MIETIYEDEKKRIKISVEQSYDQKFLEFAETTIWGTENTLYKMNGLKAELDSFRKPIYVSLKENEELVGIAVLNQKQVCQNDVTFEAFYGCLLSARPEKMNNAFTTLKAINKVTEYIFSKFDRVIIYAHVEEDNKRSRGVLQKVNYKPLTTFIAPSHVRFTPKLDSNVSKLDKESKAQVIELISKQYRDHSFVDVETSFDAESYYVIKENNEIKAGLQVKKLNWTFVGIAGAIGFLMMRVVPKLPFLRKIFNPKNHCFLKIGNIYIKDGTSFSKLLSSVMYMNKLNTCLAYTNPQSSVDKKIIEELKKGILSSLDTKIRMVSRTKNITVDEISMPQFLSLTDSI
jgi:RimJ/RimL family protein N-acetyltransferase